MGKLMFGRSGGKPEPETAKKAGVLGMLTGVAGTAIGLMQPKFGVGTIAKWAALAVFMPIVAGMGGNAGTQTLTVFVRGLALGEIDWITGWRPIWK